MTTPVRPTDPLYNSRIIDTFIKLIKRKYTYINIPELLTYAGMQPYEVADQGHWFTQDQIDRFYEKLVQLSGNENIAREAGRFAASPEALGVLRQYILGLVGPASAFELIDKTTSNITKSSSYEAKKIDSNKVEIVVTPKEGVQEKPFQCQNRKGFFEAAVMMFNHDMPHIDHSECIFEGGDVCRYTLSWKKSSAALWQKLTNYVVLILSLFCLLSIINVPLLTITTIIPISIFIILLLITITEKLEKKELKTSVENIRGSNENLVQQIDINYNNALMSNEIGQAISKHTNIDDILSDIIGILKARLDYDRGVFLLANPEQTRLEFRGGFGYSPEFLQLLKKANFRLDRPESQGAFVVSFREKRPFLINDLNEIEDSLSLRSLALARKLGTRSFICCPIICDGESLGVLAVDNPRSKRPLVQSDMSLLMGIAPVIGVSIRNAHLLEERQKKFDSILQVMAVSIDARDPLTAGHSEKVTEYAIGICVEMEMSQDYTEMIRVAALLHDYGKIGVPDAILKKNGRLTEDEYEIVKSHAQKTQEILQQINFEGLFRQIPEIAGSHHEKIDGSGYPRGLKGKEIPLGARIIAVADFFEAITSKRHYRDPMPFDVAFRLLREESGVHFDSKVVEAFMRYYTKKYKIRTLHLVS